VADVVAPSKIVEQSNWYGKKARNNRRFYIVMKTGEIVLAAAIPVVSVFGDAAFQRPVTALLGALVGVIEGVLNLGQYQQNWLVYRAAREALRREELLFSEGAGPYAQAGPQASQLFVERADAIISGENTKWVVAHQQPSKNVG